MGDLGPEKTSSKNKNKKTNLFIYFLNRKTKWLSPSGSSKYQPPEKGLRVPGLGSAELGTGTCC